MDSFNCTEYPTHLRPDPDISGIGVLYAFIISAGAALFCCIFQSFLNHNENIVKDPVTRACLVSALGGTILGFGDQQLVTGFSIIIASYVQLNRGISSYHWQIVGNLAWFSTITHLITLTSLRNLIRSNNVIRWIRIVFMGILTINLMFVMGGTGYLLVSPNNIPDSFPALCLYRPQHTWIAPSHPRQPSRQRYNGSYIAVSYAILLFGYFSRVFALFRNDSEPFFHRWPSVLRGQPWRFLETKLAQWEEVRTHNTMKRLACRALYKLLRSVYATVLVGRVLYASTVWEFTWLAFALIWGVIRITVSHNKGVDDHDEHIGLTDAVAQEKCWGFGQVVSMLLLILPIIGFIGKVFKYAPEVRLWWEYLLTETAEGYYVEKQAQLMPKTPDLELATEHLIQTNLTKSLPEPTHDIPLSPPGEVAADQVTESPNTLPENTKVRLELKAEAWYKYLICLCYGFSIQVAVDLLYSFPATGGTANLSSGVGFKGIVMDYFLWTVPNLMTVLASNLVFLDKDLQRLWKSSKLGRLVCTSRWVRFGWVFIVLVLFLLPAGIELSLCFVNKYLWLQWSISQTSLKDKSSN